MGRRVIKLPSTAAQQLALGLDPQPGRSKPKPKKRNPGTPFEIKRAIQDIERRVEEEDWEKMRPGMLVALFAWCHEKTYGVAPADLKGQSWRNAQRCAGMMVKKDFGGDIDKALEFLRWTWQRERRIEQWRRDNNQHGKVIGWYDQFQRGELLTKYRVDVARGQDG
jgi:hypothetical protein